MIPSKHNKKTIKSTTGFNLLRCLYGTLINLKKIVAVGGTYIISKFGKRRTKVVVNYNHCDNYNYNQKKNNNKELVSPIEDIIPIMCGVINRCVEMNKELIISGINTFNDIMEAGAATVLHKHL